MVKQLWLGRNRRSTEERMINYLYLYKPKWKVQVGLPLGLIVEFLSPIVYHGSKRTRIICRMPRIGFTCKYIVHTWSLTEIWNYSSSMEQIIDNSSFHKTSIHDPHSR